MHVVAGWGRRSRVDISIVDGRDAQRRAGTCKVRDVAGAISRSYLRRREYGCLHQFYHQSYIAYEQLKVQLMPRGVPVKRPVREMPALLGLGFERRSAKQRLEPNREAAQKTMRVDDGWSGDVRDRFYEE